MKKLELLLLEDDTKQATQLTLLLHTYDYLVSTANNITEAENLLNEKLFDIIVLDIMIDGKPDGLLLAQELNKKKANVPFLFLTSIQTKTIFEEAKYTKPFNYLLKPYNELEVLYALELALESHYEQSNTLSSGTNNVVLSPDFLFIKKKNRVVKVLVSSINCIKVEERYCHLLCDNNIYFIKLSLSKIQEILANPIFSQTHRNYLVNINKIKEIYFEDNLVILDNNEKVPFSERYKTIFIKKNNIYR